jgi:hypothetical protein
VIKVYCYTLIFTKASGNWDDLAWPKFMIRRSLHIDEYVLKTLQVFETNLMGVILMGLHIYIIILSDLCSEFM